MVDGTENPTADTFNEEANTPEWLPKPVAGVLGGLSSSIGDVFNWGGSQIKRTASAATSGTMEALVDGFKAAVNGMMDFFKIDIDGIMKGNLLDMFPIAVSAAAFFATSGPMSIIAATGALLLTGPMVHGLYSALKGFLPEHFREKVESTLGLDVTPHNPETGIHIPGVNVPIVDEDGQVLNSSIAADTTGMQFNAQTADPQELAKEVRYESGAPSVPNTELDREPS